MQARWHAKHDARRARRDGQLQRGPGGARVSGSLLSRGRLNEAESSLDGSESFVLTIASGNRSPPLDKTGRFVDQSL